MRAITYLFIGCFLTISFSATAKNGYKIKLNFTDVKEDAKVILGYYHGKGGSVYRIDSTILKNGRGILRSKEKINGGLYAILFPDRVNVDLVILNGDAFSITTQKSNAATNFIAKGHSENNLFYSYQKFLQGFGTTYNQLKTEYSQAKTAKDSTMVFDKMKRKNKELVDFRAILISQYPGSFVASLFRAIAEPIAPDEKDWPEFVDSTAYISYPSLYYRDHYWDTYDFQDGRLIYSPVYEPKLKNYMDKWVIPIPDSVIIQCDRLLKKAEGSKETFKYTLWYLTYWSESSKIMGMEEVFVHLIENYHKIGKAPWMKPAQLQKYLTKVEKISPSICGKTAPDINVRTMNNQFKPLSSVKANYTVLVFYEADCGHCKKELPKLNALYEEELHKYGVKLFAVETTNLIENWKKIITEKKLTNGWIHTYDPERITQYRLKYNVETVPAIFLLDNEKTIIGRRINHSNILDVIQYYENKKKE